MADPRQRDLTQIQIYERLYKATKNPLFVRWALLSARARSVRVPVWVRHYYDREAANFYQIAKSQRYRSPAARRRLKPAPAVMVALEFKRPGRSGRGQAFTDADAIGCDWSPGLQLATRVTALIECEGLLPDKAALIVAHETRKAKSTVWDAWRKYGHVFSGTLYVERTIGPITKGKRTIGPIVLSRKAIKRVKDASSRPLK